MSHSSTTAFLSYWHALQTAEARKDAKAEILRAPLRSNFDPVQLKDLMPQMMMVATAENNYRFRLSGGFLITLHGHWLKQSPLPALFHAQARESLKIALNMAAHREQPLILNVSGQIRNETSQTETLRLDIALAPLRNAEGNVDRMVGLYQPLGPMSALPRDGIGPLNLISAKLYDPAKLPRSAHLRLISLEGKRIA